MPSSRSVPKNEAYRRKVRSLLTDQRERTLAALDGDPMTGVDQELARDHDPLTSADRLFARDGNVMTKRNTDRAFDGDATTHSEGQGTQGAQAEQAAQQKKRKLPTPFDVPKPAPRGARELPDEEKSEAGA